MSRDLKHLWIMPDLGRGHMVLFNDNENLFMSLVLSEDAGVRQAAFSTIDEHVASALIRYGLHNDTDTLDAAQAIYREDFIDLPIERRKDVYKFVKHAVRQTGGIAAGALTPFMVLDWSQGIVATATIDYVNMGSLIDDDPMSRPSVALDLVKKGAPAESAAIIGALLGLGDQRICELLRPMRSEFSLEDIETIGKCHSGFVARCTVTFYLEWLEELVDKKDVDSEDRFGVVAAGLYNLISNNAFPFIAAGRRQFPAPVDGEWPYLRWEDPANFARSRGSRLLYIESRESVPRVMPFVIRAFGLEPNSSSEETTA